MSYEFLVIDDVIARTVVKVLLKNLGRGLAIENRTDFEQFIKSEQAADFALCDLRWRDDGSEVDFDGLDAIGELERTGACRRVIVITEGGSSYRHWIEEARRSPIVVAGIQKLPDDLEATVRQITEGAAEYWDIRPPGRAGRVVVDVLGARKRTAKGRLVSALLDQMDYGAAKERLVISRGVIKDTAIDLVNELREIGENLDGLPQPALASWMGENRSYLLGWRRRVEASEAAGLP